jgi:hypothetical protein
MTQHEDVINLVEGVRLDLCDLRDIAKDPKSQGVRDTLTAGVLSARSDLEEIIRILSPYSQAAE